MSTWTSAELTSIGNAEELEIAARRRDGTLRKPVTIWVVHHGDDLYVRSVNGRGSAWFCGVQARHEGHVRAGSVEKDVRFIETDALNDQLDAAYRAKYHRYAQSILDHITSAGARAATLKLEPGSAA